jgi:hypothetical protein
LSNSTPRAQKRGSVGKAKNAAVLERRAGGRAGGRVGGRGGGGVIRYDIYIPGQRRVPQLVDNKKVTRLWK